MASEYKLKGHESFALRDGWITKGLVAINNDQKLFSNGNASDVLGVGTNMAKSIRYWLKAAGLTTESKDGVKLSEIGSIIFENDKYIEDIFTLWIIHSNIARNYELATTWNCYFNKFLASSYKRDELILRMQEILAEQTENDDIPERSVRDDITVLLAMYSKLYSVDDPEEKKSSPFSELELIKNNGSNFENKQPSLEDIDPLIILYFISDELTKDGFISIDEIVSGDNMPGKVLHLSRMAVNDYLDKLQANELIIVNRTAGLDQVYPHGAVLNKTNILERYYRGRQQYEA